MPPGGVAGRAEPLATLSRLSHEIAASRETARLLDTAGEPEPGSDAAAVVRLARREHERATKLPSRLVAETLARDHASRSRPGGGRAPTSDFGPFAPHLEKILELRREAAGHLGYADHPYDALLDRYEPGATTPRLRTMFEELKNGASCPMVARGLGRLGR